MFRKIEAVCVCGEMCSNNACDLNCVCSFRMSFLFVFVCLYISNCSRVSSFRPFVCTCSMFMLLSMFLYVRFASMRWFAKVDSVVEWSAFVCSTYLCLKLRPVWPMQNLLQFEQFSL